MSETLRLIKRQAKEIRLAMILWRSHDASGRRLTNAEVDDIIIDLEDLIKRRSALSRASTDGKDRKI